jgi:hypothetical protein
MKTRKREMAMQSWTPSSTINSYLDVKTVGEMERQFGSTRRSIRFPYRDSRTISFKLMVCTIVVIATPFNQKFTCCWTKTMANIKKDMAQFAAKQVLNELNGAYFISVMTDTSN